MSSLFHLEHEKQYLSALIRNPAIRADTTHINERDFSPTHRVIFQAIEACLASGPDGLNKFTLASKLDALSIRIGEAIEPKVYINALTLIEVNDTAAVEIAKQLKRTTVRRELHATGMEIARSAERDEGKNALELVGAATAAFNRKVNVLGSGDEQGPEDIHDTIEAFLTKETQYDVRSIATPFPVYNDLYGHLDPGGLYVFVSRMKVGKSTLLMSTLQQIVEKDEDFVGLILDTELSAEEVQSRIISALTGIKEFHIRHGYYRRSREMRDKVDEARERIKPYFGKMYHQFVGGMDLEQQLSIARRWYHKHVHGTNRRALIAIDYLKLGSSGDFDRGDKRDIVIGRKADAFKNLAKELRVPVWAMVQANRDGEDSKGAQKMTNSSVIAGSDMIAAFCSNAYLLERLTVEEKVQYGLTKPGDATHSLKLIVPRQLGPNDLGKDGLVQYKDERGKVRYIDNFILLSFQNFVVKEASTFRDLVARNQIAHVPVQAPTEGATMDDGGKIL